MFVRNKLYKRRSWMIHTPRITLIHFPDTEELSYAQRKLKIWCWPYARCPRLMLCLRKQVYSYFIDIIFSCYEIHILRPNSTEQVYPTWFKLRQLSSMIHSARPTVSPVANIFFRLKFVLFWEVETDGRTCAKTMITTGRDCGSGKWINLFG